MKFLNEEQRDLIEALSEGLYAQGTLGSNVRNLALLTISLLEQIESEEFRANKKTLLTLQTVITRLHKNFHFFKVDLANLGMDYNFTVENTKHVVNTSKSLIVTTLEFLEVVKNCGNYGE